MKHLMKTDWVQATSLKTAVTKGQIIKGQIMTSQTQKRNIKLAAYVLGALFTFSVPLATYAVAEGNNTSTQSIQNNHESKSQAQRAHKRPWYEHFEKGERNRKMRVDGMGHKHSTNRKVRISHAKDGVRVLPAPPPHPPAPLSPEQKEARQARFEAMSAKQFAYFDLNKDGYITQEEVIEVMETQARRSAKAFFKKLDNGTGQIDEAAFREFLKEKRPGRIHISQ